jgi:hypothetical protein
MQVPLNDSTILTINVILQMTIFRDDLKYHKVIWFWSLGICFHNPKHSDVYNVERRPVTR